MSFKNASLMSSFLCGKGEKAGKKGGNEPIFKFCSWQKNTADNNTADSGQLQTALNNLRFSEAVDCLSPSSCGWLLLSSPWHYLPHIAISALVKIYFSSLSTHLVYPQHCFGFIRVCTCREIKSIPNLSGSVELISGGKETQNLKNFFFFI